MENRILGYQAPAAGPRVPVAAGDGFTPQPHPTLARGRQMLETSLIDHPAVGVAVAVTLGLVIGWFLKRR